MHDRVRHPQGGESQGRRVGRPSAVGQSVPIRPLAVPRGRGPPRAIRSPPVRGRTGRSSDSRARSGGGSLARSTPITYWPSLPGRWLRPVVVTTVVLDHRCGAVPVSHRIPCCLRRPGWPSEPVAWITIYGNNTDV